jgi:hypothetical protein
MRVGSKFLCASSNKTIYFPTSSLSNPDCRPGCKMSPFSDISTLWEGQQMCASTDIGLFNYVARVLCTFDFVEFVHLILELVQLSVMHLPPSRA